MALALIASAGNNANTYLAKHMAELGYARPLMVASGGEGRRRMDGKEFAVVVINTPLPDEFGHELALYALEKTHAGVVLLAKAGTAEHLAETLQTRGVLVLTAKTRVRLLPPLTIGWDDLKTAVAVLKEVIAG